MSVLPNNLMLHSAILLEAAFVFAGMLWIIYLCQTIIFRKVLFGE